MRNVCACLLVGFMLDAQICRVNGQQSSNPYTIMMPDRRGQCFEILELERLRIDPRSGKVTFYPQDKVLYMDYTAVTSWLQGFIAGRQVNNTYPAPQIATWLFSYCRTNPTKSLYDAALQFSDSLNQH
jgi:hypothetical protein